MRFFSLGSTPTSGLETIDLTSGEASATINTGDTEAGIVPPTGTRVIGWFSDKHGSLPVDYSRYVSGDIYFQNAPTWDSTKTYQTDARVVFTSGIHYKSNIDNNTSTPPTNWTAISESTEFGGIQYSPFTDDKANVWRNNGSNANDSTAGERIGGGFFDSNLVIFDDDFFRSWVNFKDTNPANIPANYLYSGTTFYRGLRLLVDGTAAGILATDQFGAGAGKDRRGKSYTDSVSEYDGNEWRVKYNATSSTNTMQVAVLDEGINYEWNDGGGTWDSLKDQDQGIDNFHHFNSIANVQGPDARTVSFSTNLLSAIEVKYSTTVLDQRLIVASPEESNKNYYRKGAWLNFAFPFPMSTFVGDGVGGTITEGVGELYGGTTSTGQEPATLDTENMHLTSTGLRGFNQTDSEDFGQISSVDFSMRMHESLLDSDGTLTLDGNFKMRCALTDTSDNVVIQDFVIPFNNEWTYIKLALSGFKNYRARKPRYDGFAEFIPPKEIEILQQFEWRNLKFVSIHTMEAYDEQGRYFPEQGEVGILGSLLNIPKIIVTTRRLAIDAFHFTKPLLKLSSTDSTRNLESKPVREPTVIIYDQADAIVQAHEELVRFRHKEFDTDTSGKFKTRYGDSYFITNTRTINDADSGANTIKCVATRIEYSITSKGFRRRILGAKRFT